MNLEEGTAKFIQAWGTFGSKWGINRTMAQIHALLLVSAEALSADEVMEALMISRGNANMNLRELMDWNLVFKELKPGERKEFFVAEKDIWKIGKEVTVQRKKRELEPMMRTLDELQKIEGDKKDPNFKTFQTTISDLYKFSNKIDNSLDTFVKADEHWFFGTLLKVMR